MIAYGLVECVLISYFKLYHRLTLFSKMKKTSGELVYHSTSRGLRRYKPRLFLSLSFQSQSTYINIFYTGALVRVDSVPLLLVPYNEMGTFDHEAQV